MNGKFSIVRDTLGALTLLYFSYLMLDITLEYIPVQTDVAFLRIKQNYVHISYWYWAFYVHVFTSMFVLLSGLTQFSPYLRKRYPKVHQYVGYVYILDILFVTGPASLIMAFYANGYFPSRLAFTILAILWIVFTGFAWYYASKKDWSKHRDFMIRSYALTLSAITLRLWKLGIALTLAPRPMDLYQVVAWLGFVPNLLVAEIYIRYWLRRRGREIQHL